MTARDVLIAVAWADIIVLAVARAIAFAAALALLAAAIMKGAMHR